MTYTQCLPPIVSGQFNRDNKNSHFLKRGLQFIFVNATDQKPVIPQGPIGYSTRST